MEKELFELEVQNALDVLRSGGIILYPTDTIWGLGCDALDEKAVARIYQLKNREDSKSMIILLADDRDIMKYVAAPDPAVFDFIEQQERPTTIIFDHAIGLAENVIAEDGSVAIRLTSDPFCRHLIKRLQRPIVSTSANISGGPSPGNFKDISEAIRSGVDYVVKWRQDDTASSQPSRIIKWKGSGEYDVIRK